MSDDRTDFAESLINNLIDAGLSHPEVCDAVKVAADLFDLAAEANMDPVTFMRTGLTKEAFSGSVGSAISPAALAATAKWLFDGAARTSSNVAGRVIDGAIRMGPLAAGAAVLTPGVLGYGAGQFAAHLSDDPDPVVRSIQQQELISTLQRNALRLRKQKERNAVSSEEVDDTL